MYLRTTKVKRSDGRVDEYIRLVECYWNNGTPRHRVICNLGRKELLAPHADALLRLLKGEPKPTPNNTLGVAIGAWDWGPLLVARHFWNELGLQKILDVVAPLHVPTAEFSDRALALVTNRLCEPTSEHGLARWLETDYVCDRAGQRWLPEWRDEAERLASRRPRVRVKDRQLRRWYGTLDGLIRHKMLPIARKRIFLNTRRTSALASQSFAAEQS